MTVYTLPRTSLRIYTALEPHISGRIMELHHSKHHANYVAGANAALEKLAAARESGDFAAINLWEKNLAFNLGGHTNHSIFWTNMTGEGRLAPRGRARRRHRRVLRLVRVLPGAASPPPPWACRVPAGPSSRGTPSASTRDLPDDRPAGQHPGSRPCRCS